MAGFATQSCVAGLRAPLEKAGAPRLDGGSAFRPKHYHHHAAGITQQPGSVTM